MYRPRHTYWTCSTFADWIRSFFKIKKPNAATSRTWVEWRHYYKNTHPIVYWITEEGLDILQDVVYFIPDCLAVARTYIRNRYFDKLHYLPTGLKPGEYNDVDTRLLHGMFEALVDFVEIEKAHMQLISEPEEFHKYKVPFWYRRWIRLKTWRCPAAGIDYLNWEMTLKHNNGTDGEPDEVLTPQADGAREILQLYTWWKVHRPNRPDPHDAGGWTNWCKHFKDGDVMEMFSRKKTPEEKMIQKEILGRCQKIEQSYYDQDESMMIRLIKIRNVLWT